MTDKSYQNFLTVTETATKKVRWKVCASIWKLKIEKAAKQNGTWEKVEQTSVNSLKTSLCTNK